MAITGVISGIIIYTKNQDKLEAEKNAQDAKDVAPQVQEIKDANKKQVEYNRSVGRPDNAN